MLLSVGGQTFLMACVYFVIYNSFENLQVLKAPFLNPGRFFFFHKHTATLQKTGRNTLLRIYHSHTVDISRQY